MSVLGMDVLHYVLHRTSENGVELFHQVGYFLQNVYKLLAR